MCRIETSVIWVKYGSNKLKRRLSWRSSLILLLSLMMFHARLVKASFMSRSLRARTASHIDLAAYSSPARRVAIVGGGVAGLSVAYHLLKHQHANVTEKLSIKTCRPRIQVTIFDQTASPGLGGASAVAGGLLHPFSPRGKIVHLGKEALEVANQLIHDASRHSSNVILRHKLYRLATTHEAVKQLQQTAMKFPHLARWMSPDQIVHILNGGGDNKSTGMGIDFTSVSTTIMGGLELSHGCKVVHLPSYLQALWKECQYLSKLPYQDADSSENNNVEVQWIQIKKTDTATSSPDFWQQQLHKFDTIVYAAGSGMFLEENLETGVVSTTPSSSMFSLQLPISLVRGQSIELDLLSSSVEHVQNQCVNTPAILCGKYLSPLPQNGRVLLGATHEHKLMPLSQELVKIEIQKRTAQFLPMELWDRGHIHQFTSGWRVQSNRGAHGRLPIIGKLSPVEHAVPGHDDAWIFTGLSSRGLLYHGLFGKILSHAILSGSEENMKSHFPEVCWWR